MSAIPPYVHTLSAEILDDINTGTFWSNLTDEHTHASDRHAGVSHTDLLDRLFQDNLTQSSSFASTHDMQECVTECVLSNLETICLNVRKSDQLYAYSVRLQDEEFQGDDPVDFQTRHTGIVRTNKGYVREMSTDMTTIVVRPAPNSKYGFKLVTAFPEMSAESAYETNHNLTAECQQTEAFKKSSAMKRAYMLAATDMSKEIDPRCSIAFKESNIESTISIGFDSLKNPATQHVLFIDDINTMVRTYMRDSNGTRVSVPCTIGNNGGMKLNLNRAANLQEFAKEEPAINDYLKYIQDTIQSERDRSRNTTPRRLPDFDLKDEKSSDFTLER